jgi:hypothetical protein
MITEPELTGDDDAEDAEVPDIVADLRNDAEPVGGGGGPSRTGSLGSLGGSGGLRGPNRLNRLNRLSGRTHWPWAVGGAVVASAIWAALLSSGLGPHQHDKPDLHGYRITNSPCQGGTFDAISKAVKGEHGSASTADIVHGAAVDRAKCSFVTTAQPRSGWTTAYIVSLAIELHKLTDPRAEFEDARALDAASLDIADNTSEVPGIGDKAYALAFDDQSQDLKVLYGGAVLTLNLTANTYWTGSGPGPIPGDLVSDTVHAPRTPDLQTFTPALVTTARSVMAALHS